MRRELNMKLTITVLLMLLLCTTLPTCATLPSTGTTNLTTSFDTDALPSPLYILNNQVAGEGSEAMNVAMVCNSRTDTTNGACPTVPVWTDESGAGAGSIPLRFTQDRTGATKDIVITATRGNGGLTRQPWTSANSESQKAPVFNYYVSQSELGNLTDGVWRATLIMNYQKYRQTTKIGTWTANLVLTVISKRAQQVYLPAFPSTVATVDLNLASSAGSYRSTTASGSTSLDMCLYDGNNGTGKIINLIFKDEGAPAPGRQAGLFSVYRAGGSKSDAANRIDYALSVHNPVTGIAQRVVNGTGLVWNTATHFTGRLVTLPGYSTQTYCVPAPLTFTTPPFTVSGKQSGKYTGTLSIIYTPSTG
jgi:hypothetical protein